MKYSDYIKHPYKLIAKLGKRSIGRILVPDKVFLRCEYRTRMGTKLNIRDPQTFNEKLQWLKIHDRNPLYTTLVDKYEVKKYVGELLGEQYIIPTLGIWDSFDEVDFDKLPDQFVLKCTHDSGSIVICRDKTSLDMHAARDYINSRMQNNYYWHGREWPYKNVRPRVFAEKYMQNGQELNLKVYKVLNFNGVPRIIQTIQNDKTPNESIDYFDSEWNLLELHQNFPNSTIPTQRPATLDIMLDLSAKCSEGFPFLRTDWYEINGKVYFSEFTFYSDAGMEPFHPSKWDKILGEWITLP